MRLLLVTYTLSLLATIGCNQNTSSIAEEAPCLFPIPLMEDARFGVRTTERDGIGLLLITQQTDQQRSDDESVESHDFIPHGDVFAYDPIQRSFQLADSSTWDEAKGTVIEHNGNSGDAPFGFSYDLAGRQRPQLSFHGHKVPVVGGTVVEILDAGSADFGAPPVVAVVSTTGIWPGLLSSSATGQHYHQLYSEVTGEPIGPTVPLAIGGSGYGPLNGNWVADHRYVVWRSSTIDGLCVIDVQAFVE